MSAVIGMLVIFFIILVAIVKKNEISKLRTGDFFLIYISPFFIDSVLICFLKTVSSKSPINDWFLLGSILISELVGYYFLRKKFKDYSTRDSFVYLFVLFGLVLVFEMVISMMFFGETL